MQEVVLAADLGGTNLRMAVVSVDGSIPHRLRHSTPASKTSNEIIEAITLLAAECRQTFGSGSDLKKFGIAVPAIVSAADGTIISSPNLPKLNGIDIASELSERLGLKVLLENDANAAAVGENWLGASRDVDNSICVTLGTGVGGGLIINGRLVRGIDGTAGEVGHINVQPDGHPCGCGSWGCLEQYASATAVVRLALELASKYPDSPIAGRANVSATEVFKSGQEGDALSLEVFRQVGTNLGIALAGLINVLNPEVIVIGGGASAGWELFIEHVQHQINERAFRQPGESVRLFRAALGDDAGILGSAKLAFNLPSVGGR